MFAKYYVSSFQIRGGVFYESWIILLLQQIISEDWRIYLSRTLLHELKSETKIFSCKYEHKDSFVANCFLEFGK